MLLPDVEDYSPKSFAPDDRDSSPESPLARATEWVAFDADLASDPEHGWTEYLRETNTMPQWAGSCWYYLRYLDPHNTERFVDPDVERYWLGPQGPGDPGGVDLYVGGVEHAVLHLLYARFWHKVLFDLGHVSSSEPFRRLFNQGYVQAWAYTDARGVYVPAEEVAGDAASGFTWNGEPVRQEYGKMGKSLRNVVTPDEMCDAYGADTFRLYEMSTGPMEASRPWSTRDVVGSHRFLQRVWRLVIDEQTGDLRVADTEPDRDTLTALHRAIDGVRTDLPGDALQHRGREADRAGQPPDEDLPVGRHAPLGRRAAGAHARAAVPAPGRGAVVAPGPPGLARVRAVPGGRPGPARPRTRPSTRSRSTGRCARASPCPRRPAEDEVRTAALADPKVAELLAGAEPRKVIVVPGRLVNVVR